MHDKCFPTDKGEICATEINPKTKTLIKYGYCVKNKTKKVKKVKKVKKLKLVALTKTKKLKKNKTKTNALKKKQNMTRKSKKLKLVKSLKLKSKKMNNEKYQQCPKWKSSTTVCLGRFQQKWTTPLNSAHFGFPSLFKQSLRASPNLGDTGAHPYALDLRSCC